MQDFMFSANVMFYNYSFQGTIVSNTSGKTATRGKQPRNQVKAIRAFENRGKGGTLPLSVGNPTMLAFVENGSLRCFTGRQQLIRR